MKKPNLRKKLQSLSNNSLLGLLMTISVLVVSLGVVLSKSWLADIRFNSKVLSAKNDVNATLEQNVKALPDLQQNFQLLTQNGPKPAVVLKALPTSEQFAGLGRDLEAMAALSGVQLTSTTKPAALSEAVPVAGQPLPVVVSLQVTATGSYAKLAKFIQTMEQSARPLRFTTLSFSGNEPEVTLSVSLTTWWQSLTVLGETTEEIHE